MRSNVVSFFDVKNTKAAMQSKREERRLEALRNLTGLNWDTLPTSLVNNQSGEEELIDSPMILQVAMQQ